MKRKHSLLLLNPEGKSADYSSGVKEIEQLVITLKDVNKTVIKRKP